eukprot:68968-Alexandrium_andersonii.AAC.1
MRELSTFDYLPQKPRWAKLAAYRQECRAKAAECVMAFLRGDSEGAEEQRQEERQEQKHAGEEKAEEQGKRRGQQAEAPEQSAPERK